MSPIKILLVENDPVWQDAMENVLISPDFQLEIARTFPEAITKLQNTYDLVVTNLCLKTDNDFWGEALLSKLDKLRIPCIVLTGSSCDMTGLSERHKVSKIYTKGKRENFNEGSFLAGIYGIIGKSKMPSKGKPEGNKSIKRKNNDKLDASAAASSQKVIIKVSGDVTGNITVGDRNQAKSVLETAGKKEAEAADGAGSERTE